MIGNKEAIDVLSFLQVLSIVFVTLVSLLLQGLDKTQTILKINLFRSSNETIQFFIDSILR